MTLKYLVCGHTQLVNVALDQLKSRDFEYGYLPLCEERPVLDEGIKVFEFEEARDAVNEGHCKIMIACPQFYEAMKFLAGNGVSKEFIEIHPLSFFM